MLNRSNIIAALQALGAAIDRKVEILIVGGAAGSLTGQLPPASTTEDVDLIACHLPEDRDAVLQAADKIGRTLALPASWLSDFSGLFRWTLPDDWRKRAVEIGTFGRLRVLAVGRLDLLAMKFLSHRAKDREHLQQMNVTHSELMWVRKHVRELINRFPDERSRIELTLNILDAWNGS
jgi:hypothetical protein